MGGVCTAFLLGFSTFPLIVIQQKVLGFRGGGVGEAVNELINELYLLFCQKR